MLIKGEGGPADPKRAVSLLSSWRASDVPGVKGALGLLYIEGKLVPRDLKKGIDLFRTWASWDYDARLQLMMQGQQQAERGRGLNPSRIAEGVLAQADAV